MMPIQSEYLPTPRQIAEACFRIRQQWTPAERRRRMVGGPLDLSQQVWLPPRIEMAQCIASVRKEVLDTSA
ncbi:MAG: hypothetical protein JW829_08060 [Pirellulales bacterium]|nr:hypothetical protein [Pirellulales bacterium]